MPATPASPPTQSEWIERLHPLLSQSLDTLSERITSHPSVQAWLQQATLDMAQELHQQQNLQAQAQAHQRLLDHLLEHFPALANAVDTMTHGWGRLDVHWRPMEPNYSRLYVDFDTRFDVDVCCPLDAVTHETVDTALHAVEEALPAGTPFPNRPNTATGLVVHHDTGAGVRYEDRVNEDGQRWRRVTLLAADRKPLKHLEPAEAAATLLRFFQSADAA